LRVLIYAIRNILRPTLVYEQIPDLLRLLGHVNVIRKYAIFKTTAILKWNERYVRYPQPDVRTLSDTERELLEGFSQGSEGIQKLYRDVVNAFCYFDVYNTFVSSEQNIAWVGRMKTYFPGQFPIFAQSDLEVAEIRTKMLFHYELTEQELKESRLVGVRCAEFVRDAAAFMENLQAHGATSGASNHTLRNLFPPPEEASIRKKLERYLKNVEYVVAELERLFITG